MDSLSIICDDCNDPYETTRRNTRLCSRCRLLIDLIYIGSRRSKCWACDTTIAPLGRNDKSCGSCSYQPKSYGNAVCAFCHIDRPRVRRDVDICSACAHDPALRGRLIQALKKGQHARRRRNGTEVPA